MPAPKIRADYEGLKRIAQSFSTESDQIEGMIRSVQSNVDTLRGGDWVGPGASAFYQEMDSAVFPSLKRLSGALGEAARVTTRINQLMNGAERDAAAVLRATADNDTRQKSGDSGASTGSIVGGIVGGVLGFAAGGLVGAAVGAAAGAAAGDKASDLMNESSERSAADKTRQDAVQKFIRADDRQGAVDEAIKQYGIDVSGVKGKVVYDPSTPGEGETAKDGTVRIGDEAFLSPAWLASSIGHEAQHAQQARDGRWNDTAQGRAMNETEAYKWELNNADKNGLTAIEQKTLNRRYNQKYNTLTPENKARADAGTFTVP